MMKKVHCIMLIDDNPDDNFFHERVIKKCGAADIVVTRETGKEALEYLMDEKQNGGIAPDVIFLDINMPGMNGWALLDLLQQDAILSSIPVIVFSAAIPTTARVYPNVFARLTKPVDLRQFIQVVERMP